MAYSNGPAGAAVVVVGAAVVVVGAAVVVVGAAVVVVAGAAVVGTAVVVVAGAAVVVVDSTGVSAAVSGPAVEDPHPARTKINNNVPSVVRITAASQTIVSFSDDRPKEQRALSPSRLWSETALLRLVPTVSASGCYERHMRTRAFQAMVGLIDRYFRATPQTGCGSSVSPMRKSTQTGFMSRSLSGR